MNCLSQGFTFEIGRFLAKLAIGGGILCVSFAALGVLLFILRRR